VLQRPAPGENLTIVGLPRSRHIDQPYRVNNVATALEDLQLIDVRPASELDFAGDGRQATFTLDDGLVLRAVLAADPDGNRWDWVAFEGGIASGQAGRQSDRLQAMLGPLEGWAYRVPGYKASRFVQELDDITEER